MVSPPPSDPVQAIRERLQMRKRLQEEYNRDRARKPTDGIAVVLSFAELDTILAALGSSSPSSPSASEDEQLEYREYDFSKGVRAYEKVTRFEVIDESGRAYVRRPCKLALSLQDDGRTLKAFVDERAEALSTVGSPVPQPDQACPNCGRELAGHGGYVVCVPCGYERRVR